MRSMAREIPMPSNRPKFTHDTFNALVRRFDAAPPAPKPPDAYSVPTLVRMLGPKIRLLIEKGYGWTAIAALMSEDGVTVRPNVLRKYAAGLSERPKSKRRPKSESGGAPKRIKPVRAADSNATPSAVASASAPRVTTGATPEARDVAATDDAWENIEPLEETGPGRSNAPDAAPAHTTGGTSSSPAQSSVGRSWSSSFVIRPDTERI
jgi:hypothetical protein